MNLEKQFLTLITLLILCSCASVPETNKEKYISNVGDIQNDPKIDSLNFKPCSNNVLPLYKNGNIYEGEKIALVSEFTQNFDITTLSSIDDGYITLRFVVNCNKKIGMIRTEAFDFNYKPKEIEKEVLLELHKALLSLNKWSEVKDKEGNRYDYFQYLTLKITNGKIETILP
ncbi:MAG: hypothetical protein IPN86_02665 [Saprospiraceae bacterium]|nr:hypothetical protein [Saprospiraceae bacterium]